jgi:hypothetical protein
MQFIDQNFCSLIHFEQRDVDIGKHRNYVDKPTL